jgi:hypothetical protein
MTDDMTTSTEGTIKARAGISGRNLVREGRNLVSVGAGPDARSHKPGKRGGDEIAI